MIPVNTNLNYLSASLANNSLAKITQHLPFVFLTNITIFHYHHPNERPTRKRIAPY
jgi:hypothetical protein